MVEVYCLKGQKLNYIERARRFRTKKSLGQNFLVDADAINKIIDSADLSKEDTVLEIGPGIGFVTEQLAQRVKKVIAVEIDLDAIDELLKLPYDNIEIIAKDILKTDIAEITDDQIKVVANIPYYITSPILAHLLGEIDQAENPNRSKIKEITLMVQYEVAKRIVADQNSPNKEYGALSLLCNYWSDTEIVMKVPASSFVPPPKVDSAVVKLNVRPTSSVNPQNPGMFRRVVNASFNTRRKNIKNALMIGGFDKEKAENALEICGIDAKRRGETFSMQEFCELSDRLNELK